MTHYTDFVKLHMGKLDKSIPAKERFKMIAKMWQANKPAGTEVVKAVKAVKAKAVKAKGGDLSASDIINEMKETLAIKAKGGNMKAKGAGFMDMFPVLKLIGGGDMKANKAKPAKRSAKAKGGALVDMHELSDDDDEQALPSVNVIEKLKANTIKRGGYQGFQGHYPDAINESVMQQLVKKR